MPRAIEVWFTLADRAIGVGIRPTCGLRLSCGLPTPSPRRQPLDRSALRLGRVEQRVVDRHINLHALDHIPHGAG